MKTLLLSLLFISISFNAYALDIKEAKAKGLVGERNDGYLGFVTTNPSTDIKLLVESVNSKRRAKFEATARKSGATLKQVSARFYQRAVQATKSDRYYQNATGDWVKK